MPLILNALVFSAGTLVVMALLAWVAYAEREIKRK